MQFDYFYGNEAEQFTFYRIPKLLISSPQFKTVSDSAKLLYGLMLDRMSLSIRNGWFDEQGRAYIFYKLNDIEEDMNCSTGKGVKLLAELDTKKGIGLIERIKQGQGKADKIYLKKFVNVDKSQTYSRVTNDEKQDLQKLDVQTSKIASQYLQKPKVQTCKKQSEIIINIIILMLIISILSIKMCQIVRTALLKMKDGLTDTTKQLLR